MNLFKRMNLIKLGRKPIDILFLILFLFSTVNLANAQVTIGSANRPKATLDINPGDNKSSPIGLLIPRLKGDEIEAMTVNEEQNSMLIYATDVSTADTPIITETGFWYYNSVSQIWEPLATLFRRNAVNVNPDGTGDYKTLQEAYDKEAPKKYSPGVGYLLFNCKGDVGDLVADGSIPSIKIAGGIGSSIKKLTVYNSILSFGGNIKLTENMTAINSYITLSTTLTDFTSLQLNLKKCLMDVNRGFKTTHIILDQSSMNIVESGLTITFEPTQAIAEGLLLKYSSFKGLVSTTLKFQGSQTFTNYIKCDDASFLNSQGTINAIAPISNAVILSMQASKASMGTINGTAIPKTVFHAITDGKIEHFRGTINLTTSGAAFLAVMGGSITLGGDAITGNSVLTNNNPSPTSLGVSAAGGDIKTASNIQPYTYTFNNYYYTLSATQGGRIVSLGRFLKGTSLHMSNLTPGIIAPNGSSIYTEE